MSFKSLFSARDVTVGKPWQRILELTIPLLIGNIAQQLYNTVDTIVVGKYVGDDALSAVGAAGPVVMMIFILFIGVATGAGILVSQRFGAKDREGLSRVIGNCITLTIAACVITTGLGLLIVRTLRQRFRPSFPSPRYRYQHRSGHLVRRRTRPRRFRRGSGHDNSPVRIRHCMCDKALQDEGDLLCKPQ